MRRHIWMLLTSGVVFFILITCAPDRMPPAPVEIDRPELVGFAAEDSGAIAVALRHSIQMTFNEPMDPLSFPGNFTLASVAGSIEGSFTARDSSIVFAPGSDLVPAHVYHATINGKIKDANGNSMSIEPNFRESLWFFTAGDYCDNGYYPVFVTDRVENRIYQLSDPVTMAGTLETVESPKAMVVTADGNHLLVTSSLSSGRLHVLDSVTGAELAKIAVGAGPTDLVVYQNTAYILNLSGRTISVVDLSSQAETNVISFSDDFRPRNMAMAPDGTRLYLTSNDLARRGWLKVLDLATGSDIANLDNVLTKQRSVGMAAAMDGNTLFIAEDKTATIAVVNLNDYTLAAPIIHSVPQNTDIKAYGDYVYLASNGGIIYKINAASRSLVDSCVVEVKFEGFDLTPRGEVLFVAAPGDTTVKMIETTTMTLLRSASVQGSPKILTVGKRK